ncbi:hypothetical protein YC2023_036635 [Brassica napus]
MLVLAYINAFIRLMLTLNWPSSPFAVWCDNVIKAQVQAQDKPSHKPKDFRTVIKSVAKNGFMVAWPRERNYRGQLQAGLGAERLGWWRNRPSVSLKWDFADQRERHGFLDRKTDKKHRKRPSEINPDRKEGERWPEGRSESELETAGLSRDRQTDPNRVIRPDGRFNPPLLDASPSCSDATGSDPYTNGSRLGYREMVPESDGLIMRILPDGRRVLTRLFWRVLWTA